MRRIGRYEILEEIGRGSMGVVYLARDPRIGRNVALKAIRLPAGLSASEEDRYRERFRREGMAAGKLNHPHIVTVYDVGDDPGTGVSFIVMEYVEGVTLKERIRSGPLLPEGEIRRIGAQLGEALDYAHRQKVVHRDIKPANVIMTRSGDAKITDFGVARLADSELTGEEQPIGSPAFMSPEQIRGGRVRAPSDLFSLGVLLYQLATRRRPFEGKDAATVMYQILNETPPPPSQVNPPRGKGRRGKRRGSRSARLSADLDRILLRLLRKDPAERFHSGRELARELARGETAGPPAPGREKADGRAAGRPPADRRRVFPAAEVRTAVGAGLLLLGFFLLWGLRSGQALPSRSAGSRGGDSAAGPTATPREPTSFWSRWFPPPERGEGTTVEIRFPHHLPSGSLTVWMDGEEILHRALESRENSRKPFGGRFFRQSSGLVQEVFSVTPGDHRFEAVVECPEEELVVRGEKEFRLPEGKAGRLLIDLDRWFGQRLDLKWK